MTLLIEQPVPKADQLPESYGVATRNVSFAEAAGWQLTLRWVAQILSWSSTIFLARLLTQEDYGVVGMALVLFGLGQVVADSGIGVAVVAQERLDEQITRQLHMLSVAFGWAMCAIFVALAHPFALFFRDPRVQNVIIVQSLIFGFLGHSIVPNALLQRSLAARRSAALELLRSVVGSLASVTAAFLGAGYWALVAGPLFGALVYSIVLNVQNPLKMARPVGSSVGNALRYAGHLLSGRLAYYASTNVDVFVVGRVLGTASLGLYNFAYSLAWLPADKLFSAMLPTVNAFLASLSRRRSGTRRFFLSLTLVLNGVILPFTAVAIVGAPVGIPAVFNARWIPAIPIFILLSIAAAFQGVFSLAGHVLNNSGQARFNSRVTAAGALALCVGFIIAVRGGQITSVAIVWCILGPAFGLLPVLRVLKRLNITPAAYFATFAPGLRLAAVGGTSSWLALAASQTLPGLARSALIGVAGVLGTGIWLWFVERRTITRHLRTVRRTSSAS